jgi:hypothetical protein
MARSRTERTPRFRLNLFGGKIQFAEQMKVHTIP